MGAWGPDSFANDEAADWAWQMDDAEDLKPVEQTFDRVFDEATSNDYVEAPTGSEAIAACEVIARLKGNYGARSVYSESVDKWVEAHPVQVDKELLVRANNALNVITSEKSELRQLWEESESYAEWQANVDDLGKRLNS